MRWRSDDFSIRYNALFPLYARLPLRLGYQLAQWHTPLFQRRKVQEATAVTQQMRAIFPDLTPEQVQTYVRGYFQMQEQEALDTWHFDAGLLGKLVQVRGFEQVKAARESGRRVILASGHYGRFWLIGAVMRALGFTTGTLTRDGGAENIYGLHPAEFRYRLFKLKKMQTVMGGTFLVEGGAIRPLYRALDEHFVALIFDVPYEKSHFGNVTVPFLNSNIELPAGIYRIAKNTKAVVAPFFMRDLGKGQVVAEFGDLLEPTDYNENAFMGVLATLLEDRIRDNPAHWWLWSALPLLQGNNNVSNCRIACRG